VASPLRPPPDAKDKLRDIRSVTDAALSYLDADDLLAALLDRVKEILDADTVAVLLLDSSGRQLIATVASGLEEEVRQGVRIPLAGVSLAGSPPSGGRSSWTTSITAMCSTRFCWKRESSPWWACRCSSMAR
jgi:hypothetical protein